MESIKEECIELKNIKYKTMLLNGNVPKETMLSDTADMDTLNIFLENEKNYNTTEPWSKLDKTLKFRKMLIFVEKYKLENLLSDEEKQDMIRIRIEKPHVAKEIDKINREKRREKVETEKWKKDLIQNDLERRKVEEKQERIENLYGVYLENLILDYRRKYSTKIIKMSQKEKDKKTEELKVQAQSEAEKEMERIERVGRS